MIVMESSEPDMEEKRKPMRTCIGCNKKKDKKQLLRIVITEEGIVLDERGRMNGRGAYMCDDPACMEKAVRGHRFNRTFRRAFSEDCYRSLEEQFDRRKVRSR